MIGWRVDHFSTLDFGYTNSQKVFKSIEGKIANKFKFMAQLVNSHLRSPADATFL